MKETTIIITLILSHGLFFLVGWMINVNKAINRQWADQEEFYNWKIQQPEKKHKNDAGSYFK